MSEARPRRILIVIGQVLSEPWLGITMSGQFPTWLEDASREDIPVRHSFGRRSGSVVRWMDRGHEWLRWHGPGRTWVPRIDSFLGRPLRAWVPKVVVCDFVSAGHVGWQQGLVDVYAMQRWKVLSSLTQCLNEDFTHVYFTTASSYVSVRELQRVINDLPESGVYAGTPLTDAISGVTFASGANRVLSRDVVSEIVSRKTAYRNDVMEDVGLGELVSKCGFMLCELPSVNISSDSELDSLADENIRSNFHFRMTSGTRDDRHDARLMLRLHRRIRSLDEDKSDHHVEG